MLQTRYVHRGEPQGKSAASSPAREATIHESASVKGQNDTDRHVYYAFGEEANERETSVPATNKEGSNINKNIYSEKSFKSIVTIHGK